MLAVPPAVVPVTRIVLVPAVRGTEMVAVAQVSQLAVTGKFSVPRAWQSAGNPADPEQFAADSSSADPRGRRCLDWPP